MIDGETPVIKCENLDEIGNHSKIIIEPLERGYGHTLGNALRRILISSLPGSAAISVKIEGVLHEFSTIRGVKEDVVDIILNIKGVIFKSFSGEFENVYINHKGEGVITAKDIECSSNVEILNPDHYIAALNEDADLNMRIVVASGTGYVCNEQNKKLCESEIGTISIDSLFTPIKKVTYSVENIMVGNVTDYDRLILEVLTNGSMSSETAVKKAAYSMIEYLNLFSALGEDDSKSSPIVLDIENDKKYNSMSIDDLKLSPRAYNCLRRAGISSINDLIGKSAEEVMKVRNLGNKSFGEILVKLKTLGLTFVGD